MIINLFTRVVGLLLLPLLATAAPANPTAEGRIVLPTSVTPDHYRIEVTPDAAKLTFKGSVQIDVTVHRPSATIVLNSADIVIDHAEVGDAKVQSIAYDEKVQTASFKLDHALPPGAHTLSLAYHGKIYQQASGLFALDYDAQKGKSRALFTQFENSDARRFVPSWDEPGHKATFELTATLPVDQMALSNMPFASTENLAGNLKRVHFAATPKMSSYLLFFGMGDFERVSRNVDGVDVGIVVKRGDTGATAFSLDAAARILPYYNSYFGVPYPLPKLDLIAAPGVSQFFGAMENWGAIFYFERDLLVDSRISTEHDKQQVYLVVAHEMAHQWFGDLVTMAWWDDLWLNEGFASWMENKVTDEFHPEWHVWLQSLRQNEHAMAEDARDGTHPIISPIKDVLQASGAFDTITYSKGAAVIRMLEAYVGADDFRAGVRRYMHDHAYGNTVTDDLWQEMDKGSRHPITQIAHDFTLQAGVPMVNEVDSGCQEGKATLQVTQSHFAVDADSTKARAWHVPVMIASAGARPETTVVFGSQPRQVQMQGCGVALLNAGQTAYFRSHYSDAGLAAITGGYANLSPEDQLGVLNDTSALAFSGQEPMSAVLGIARNFPTAADPVVGVSLVSVLRKLDNLYDGLGTQAAYRAYAHAVLAPLFTRYGWDKRAGESDNVASLRANLIAALSEFGDMSIVGEARQRFDRYRRDPKSLDAAARRTVLEVVAAHADAATWDQLHALAKAAPTELERQELYDLLAEPQDANLTRRALDLALSGEPPPTVVPDMIGAASYRHPALALDCAIAHWSTLQPLIEPASQARYVPRLVDEASNLSLIDKLTQFAEAHIPPGARQDLRKSVSNIRYLAAVRKDRLPQIDHLIAAEPQPRPDAPHSGT